MKKSSLVIIAVLASMLTGCASLTRPARIHTMATPPSPSWMDYDASRRGAYVLPKNGGLAVCAEPSPDVAYSTVASLVAQVEAQNPNITGQAQLDFQQSVVQLTTQTEALEFLRESMYRMCEQSIDGNLSSSQIKDLYDQALKTSLTLAEAQLAQQQNELARRLQDPQVRALWTQLIQQAGTAPVPVTPAQPSAPSQQAPGSTTQPQSAAAPRKQ
jgi:hypothetical protein